MRRLGILLSGRGSNFEAIADNIAVKVPLTPDGLRCCKALSSEGIMVNVTLCFSAAQAILAAKAGATFISPFVGRLDDIGEDGMALIADIVQIYRQYPALKTEVLVASVRNPKHVVAAAKLGAHVATLLHVHPRGRHHRFCADAPQHHDRGQDRPEALALAPARHGQVAEDPLTHDDRGGTSGPACDGGGQQHVAGADRQRLGAHVRMDLMVRGLSKRLLWTMEGLAVVVALIIITLLVESTFENFLRAWYRGAIAGSSQIPLPRSLALCPGFHRSHSAMNSFSPVVGNAITTEVSSILGMRLM